MKQISTYARLAALSAAALAMLSVASAATVIRPDDEMRPAYTGAELGKWTMDLDAAKAKAKAENRHVIVYWTGVWWCPHCQALEAKVILQDAWQEFKKDFYMVMMDFPARDNVSYNSWLRTEDYYTEAGLTKEQAEADQQARYWIQDAYAAPGAAVNTAAGPDLNYHRIGYPTLMILRPDGSVAGRYATSYRADSYTVESASADMLGKLRLMLAGDATDEADNYFEGANALETPQNEEEDTVYGERTVSDIDTADWYKFDATKGQGWYFTLRESAANASEELKMELYDDAKTLIETKSGIPSASPVLPFVVPESGTYYLKVSPVRKIGKLQGYTLVYSYGMPPATVSLSLGSTTVSSKSAYASLTVNIADAIREAEVAVDYEAVDGTAVAGRDFAPTSGTLVWPANKTKAAAAINIPILPTTEWRGDRSFEVVLRERTHSIIGDKFATCMVTIKESATRHPGRISFDASTLPADLNEGVSTTITLVRSNGADGDVSATVTLVDGATATDVATLAWAHGDMEPKSFDLVLPKEDGFESQRTMKLKLSTAGGAASYAPNIATIARLDELVVTPYGGLNAVFQGFNFTAPKKDWFDGLVDAGEPDAFLRCEPLAGVASTLKAQIDGPALLVFDSYAAGGATLSLGAGTAVFSSDDASAKGATLAVDSGKKTLSLTVSGPAGAHAGIGGPTLLTVPFAAAPLPLDGSFVTGNTGLAWTLDDSVDFNGALTQELYAGASKSKLDFVASLPANQTSVAAGDFEALDAAFASSAESGKPLFWRVDAVATDAQGGRAVAKGNAWTVYALPDARPAFDAAALPGDSGATCLDSLGSAVALPDLMLGVQYDFGPLAVANAKEASPLSVASIKGALPNGIKAAVADGGLTLSGVPAKVGGGTSRLQVKGMGVNAFGKPAKVVGTSVDLVWNVLDLPDVVGTYDGFAVQDDGTPGYGNATLTVGAKGALSGKFLFDGVEYKFSAKNFTGIVGGMLVAEGVPATASKQEPLEIRISVDPVNAPGAYVEVIGGGDATYHLYRNTWARDNSLLAQVVGYYTVALPVTAVNSEFAPKGSGYLTITVDKKGNAKLAATFADGRAASGTATLLVVPDCCVEYDRLAIYCMLKSSAYGIGSGLYGLFEFVPDARGNFVQPAVAPVYSSLKWVNTAPTSVFGYNPVDGTSLAGVPGFSNAVNVVGGWYDKSLTLDQLFNGRCGVLACDIGAPADFVGLALASVPDADALGASDYIASGNKLGFAQSQIVKTNKGLVDCARSTNPWKFLPSYTRATGLLSCTFYAYYEGVNASGAAVQKTLALKAKGILIQKSADPAASDWYGFYNVDSVSPYLDGGREKTYKFKQSYNLEIGSAPIR